MKIYVSNSVAPTEVMFEDTYEAQYKSKAYFCFSDTVITVMMKFIYIMDKAFTKLGLFLQKVSFISSTFFSHGHETLYVGRENFA
jgi:hypothetical protein